MKLFANPLRLSKRLLMSVQPFRLYSALYGMTIQSRLILRPFGYVDRQDGSSSGLVKKRNNTDELYVGNFNFDTTEDQIKEHFEKFGKIKSISIPKDEDGRSKGKAWITYESPKNNTLALEEDGRIFNGRALKVNLSWNKTGESKRPKDIIDKSTIYIRHLPVTIKQTNLRYLFEKFGKIEKIAVKDESNPLIKPGTAFIEFSKPEVAEKAAAAMDGKEVGKKTISVSIKSDPSEIAKYGEDTIHVGNLPSTITEEELRSIFSIFGEITKIDVKNLSSGFAFIKFTDADAAKRALKIDQRQLRGFPIDVSRFGDTHAQMNSIRKVSRRNMCSILIPNLTKSFKLEDLKEFFSQFGQVVSVAIPQEREKDFGFVQFDDIEVAQNLIKKGSVLYDGYELLIEKPNKLKEESSKKY
ncbi:unnamed protein product [Blepharisma stoltei]|uniref:RRM domain-containing protein n=1 Tax=Blepharisma stoltei TaxID=1481888 RepID=A0AAU9IQS2_9CILI|nr:unnamed protein product [Blepharisma stoltei]